MRQTEQKALFLLTHYPLVMLGCDLQKWTTYGIPEDGQDFPQQFAYISTT